MSKTVFIVSPSPAYINLFRRHNWDIVGSPRGASLVQFTGGPDVNPALYGEKPHLSTRFVPSRDKADATIFGLCTKEKVPMAGICRGAQFLNVMCGGSLWQHVDGHTTPHLARFTYAREMIKVTSTHHQLMKPSSNGFIFLEAFSSTTKQGVSNDGSLFTIYDKVARRDPEGVIYAKNRVLCFQPHPEFTDAKDLGEIYIELVSKLVEGVFK